MAAFAWVAISIPSYAVVKSYIFDRCQSDTKSVVKVVLSPSLVMGGLPRYLPGSKPFASCHSDRQTVVKVPLPKRSNVFDRCQADGQSVVNGRLPRSGTWSEPDRPSFVKDGLPRSNTWDGPDRPQEAMHKGEDTEDSFFGASWLSMHVVFGSFLTCAVARICLMSPANDMGVQASSGLLYVGIMALVATGLDLSCGITGVAVMWHLRGGASFSGA